MIDFKKPESIFKSLLSKFDGQDILPDLRIYGVYTGDFEEPANNFGAFGFLPIAGTSSGDSLGLTPIIGKEPEEWPVLSFSHNGGEATIVSSNISLLAASAMAGGIRSGSYIYEDKEEILETKKEILSLAKILGDESQAKNFIKFLEGLGEDGEEEFSKFFLYSQAEGLTWFVEFLNIYKKVYVEDENAIKNWKAYLKKNPFVTPAWELLFLAQSKGGEEAFDAAWKVATSEKYFNDFIFSLSRASGLDFDFDTTDSENYDLLSEDNARLEACQYISESDRGQGRPEFEAIVREAKEEDCSELWLDAGNSLLAKKKAPDAYRAFINAGYHYYDENSEFYSDAAKGALKAAKLIGSPLMVYALESLGDLLS